MHKFLHAATASLAVILLSPSPSLGLSKLFDVNVVSVEAFLLDSSTGALSSDILTSNGKDFRRLMTEEVGYSAPIDVLIRVKLKSLGNGNIQPDVNLIVLENFENTVPAGGSVQVKEWLTFQRDTLRFDGKGEAAITSLIREVHCSKIDVIVKTEQERQGAYTVRLPFECIEK